MYIARLLFQGIDISLFKQWSCWIWRSWWVDCTSGKCETSSLSQCLASCQTGRQKLRGKSWIWLLTDCWRKHTWLNNSDNFNWEGTGHGWPWLLNDLENIYLISSLKINISLLINRARLRWPQQREKQQRPLPPQCRRDTTTQTTQVLAFTVQWSSDWSHKCCISILVPA